MTKIVREVWIDAPRQEVWEKGLADFGNIYEWNPNVPKSYSTNNKPQGVGATRHCDLDAKGKNSIEERVTKWKEGEMMEVAIYDGKGTPPWKNPVARLEVFDENGGTRMRMTMTYEMRLGPIGKLMDMMLVKPQFGKAIGALPAGLKHYIENGRKASADQLDLNKVMAVPS